MPTFQAVQATESSQAREVFAAPKYRRGGSCLGQTKVRWSDVLNCLVLLGEHEKWLCFNVFSYVFMCFLHSPDSRISASFIPRSLDSSSAVSVSHQQHSCKRAGAHVVPLKGVIFPCKMCVSFEHLVFLQTLSLVLIYIMCAVFQKILYTYKLYHITI